MIEAAARLEAQKFKERLDEGSILLEQGRKAMASGRTDYRMDFALCLAEIDKRWPNIVPIFSELKKNLQSEGPLGAALFRAVADHGVTNFLRARCVTSRDLIPIAVLLLIGTAFNPEPLLTLKRSDVRETVDPLGGNNVIQISAYKERSDEIQTALFTVGQNNEFGVKFLFDLLERATAPIRSSAAEPYKDRWFIYLPMAGTTNKTAVGFGVSGNSVSSDAVWQRMLARFIEGNHLPKFTARTIRATIGDEVRQHLGPMAAARVLQHKNVDTSDKHYTSDGTRRRGRETIGKVQIMRTRWAENLGKSDPRASVLDSHLDRGAATPGFSCSDPFDSPLPAQKGKLCAAYGECPNCPRVIAHTRDEVAVSLYLSLRKAIYESAKGHVSPQVWLSKWGPTLQRLERIIELAPDAIQNKAVPLIRDLPTVG